MSFKNCIQKKIAIFWCHAVVVVIPDDMAMAMVIPDGVVTVLLSLDGMAAVMQRSQMVLGCHGNVDGED